MENCIFCKLANGEIPTHTLYENDEFRVIFDAGPATKGHALVIPKKHYANIFEIDDETVAKAFVLARKMAIVMKDVFNCDGFNVFQNNGESAGQSVFHFHIHLIPRHKDDHAFEFWKAGKVTDEECETMVKMIRDKMEQ